MKVNAYCRNLGWLFEDFKAAYDAHPACYVTDSPDPEADAWICIRTSDADPEVTDLSRTTIQVHDNFERTSDIHLINQCGSVVLTNPAQVEILDNDGIDWTGKGVFLRPIGAKERFYTIPRKPRDTFTVGWVGRMHRQKGRDLCSKILPLVREFADVILVGSQFNGIQEKGDLVYLKEEHPHSLWPELYAQMDCLLVTSPKEAGPIPLFEALASGVPVVSRDCGWSKEMIVDGVNGYVFRSPPVSAGDVASGLRNMARERDKWFDRVPAIRATARGWTHESWIDETVHLAASTAREKVAA